MRYVGEFKGLDCMTRFWVYVHNGSKGSQKMVARKSKYDGKQN